MWLGLIANLSLFTKCVDEPGRSESRVILDATAVRIVL